VAEFYMIIMKMLIRAYVLYSIIQHPDRRKRVVHMGLLGTKLGLCLIVEKRDVHI